MTVCVDVVSGTVVVLLVAVVQMLPSSAMVVVFVGSTVSSLCGDDASEKTYPFLG
jgi:hypothetical protein